MTTSKATPLALDGLANARDLGGLRTGDGRVVRPGSVVRCDNLRSLTEQGQADFIATVGPRTVVDLRIELEVEHGGYSLADETVTVLNFPMLPLSGVTQEQIDAGACDNLIDDYMGQIEVNGDAVIKALRVIADSGQHPVVYHCTAGKDRTGIVTAMLLGILGVDHETITADYHVTTANMVPIIERIRTAQVYKDNGLAYAPDWIFASDPETMRAFLARMTEKYGSAEAWALGRGMTPDEIESLRAGLLVDESGD
jgi:protein tyrosine/serine phosphatase